MNKNSNLIVVAGMLLPILLWVFVISYYSINLPWYDDFDPFPDFLHKWITDTTFSDRLKLLFQPNNEHRMVIGKLVTLSYYWITGQLNFTFLHIAGACFTLGTLAVFWQSFKKSRLQWWFFLPVPFLLFQLQYHLVFLWAICSLQHQCVVFFVSLSMFLLSRNKFAGAVLAAICSTYAMSNGIFVWPAGVVVLLLGFRYKQLAFWCLAGVLAVGFYFYGLSAQGNESSIAFFMKYPHLSVLGFFAFLGGLFDFFPEKTIVVRSALPVLMGFLVMIWIVIWLWRQVAPWFSQTLGWPGKVSVKESNVTGEEKTFQTFLLGILTFLLVNALIIGLLRPRFGFFVMIVSNYKMYPALFLIIAYLSFIASASRLSLQQKAFQLSLLTSIFIWGISVYSYLPVISERYKYLMVNGYNQENNAFGLGHVPFSKSAAYVDDLMKDMVQRGVYQYPTAVNGLAEKAKSLNENLSEDQNIVISNREKGLFVDDAAGSLKVGKNSGQYAFVRNQQHFYFFKMAPHKYSGRNIFRQYDKGSDVEINESESFPLLVQRINALMDSSPLVIEVVLIDDGSRDDTALKIRQLALTDERYHGVFLSRNHGHQLALTAGISAARGTEALFVIDGDLQDPPELLPEFYKLLKDGNDVVYAVRKKRKEGFVKKAGYHLFYRILRSISYVEIPLDSGDFALISRRVVDVLNKMPEESRYLRGMRSWIGFKQVGYEYERDARVAGESKYSFKQLFRLAYNGIFNFSEFPVKFMSRVGVAAILISLLYFLTVVIKKMFFTHVIEGFTSLLFVIILFSGVQLLALGIIGEYVLRIFFQSKNRPLFIIKEEIVNREYI